MDEKFEVVTKCLLYVMDDTIVRLLNSLLPSPLVSLFRAAKALGVTSSKRKCSPRIGHRSELTERDCENVVQGPGKFRITFKT